MHPFKSHASSEEVIEHRFFNDSMCDRITRASLMDIFGTSDKEKIHDGDIKPCLPRMQVRVFKDSKLRTLYKLYEQTPPRYLPYYPERPENWVDIEDSIVQENPKRVQEGMQVAFPKAMKKKKPADKRTRQTTAATRAASEAQPNQPSLFMFFTE